MYVNSTFAEIMGVGMVGAQAGNYSGPYGIFTRAGTPYPEDRLPFVRVLVERRVVVVDDIVIRRPDGSCVDVRAFARPVSDPAGTITHVVVAFFDITREVAAERARAESERRLEHAQRLEAVGTLAGGIAHDFNNLIFGIKMIAADLVRTAVDAKTRSSLALIDDITDRSATLTRSLLGFAREGAHRSQIVSVSDVVASMSELLKRTATGAQIEIELEATGRGPVMGDEAQLEQVVMNVVGNARDAVAGSGRIVIRTRDARRGERSFVVLEVLDDGPGIEPRHRDRVFEPYFTTKDKGPDRGTGLGLATVYGIVQQHGGTIEIDDGLEGRGTTIRIWLPTSSAPADTPPVDELAEAVTGSGLLLVIDDDDIVRRAMSRVLAALGYDVIEAATGAEGVEMYRARRDEVRAVVLDMVMPRMNGRAVYLALRAIDPGVRVVVMSGHADAQEVEGLLELGVAAYVPKPHGPEQLAAALSAAVSG